MPTSIPLEFRDEFGQYNALDTHLIKLPIAEGTRHPVKPLLTV
jgi:hypothetical protein